MNAKIVEIVNDIKSLTQMQLKELKETLEQVFGVTANVQVIRNMATEPMAEEKQTEFDFILKSFGATTKISVIKVLRQVTGLGLIESKAVVENCPAVIKEGISLDEAEKFKAVFEQAGAVVEIK